MLFLYLKKKQVKSLYQLFVVVTALKFLVDVKYIVIVIKKLVLLNPFLF